MRILHVYPTISRPLGWAAPEVTGLCGGQARLGNDVDLVTTNVDFGGTTIPVPLDSPVRTNGVNVRYFALDRWTKVLGKYRFQTFCYSSALRSHLVREVPSYDIVHIHTMWSYVSVVAAAACRKARCPYVISVMGALDPIRSAMRKRIFFEVFHRKDLEHAGAVHFMSEGELETAKAFPFDGKRTVIPLGIDVQKYEPSLRRGRFRRKNPQFRDAKIVTYLGRLSATKGLDLLVKAFAAVARTDRTAHLLLIGPDYENLGVQLKQIAESEGISQRLTLLGERLGEDKIEALVDSNVFVFPSYTEAFGVALAEAICCKVPAVVTDTLALAPLLSQRQAALIVQSRPESLAVGLRSVLGDAEIANRLVENAYSTACDLWDWPNVVRATLNLYESVVADQMARSTAVDN